MEDFATRLGTPTAFHDLGFDTQVQDIISYRPHAKKE